MIVRAPDILLVVCHDLGRHLGCYGRAPIESPNLDRLAAQGIRFDASFCTSPSCSPSRGSILTGRHPHANGLMGLAHLGWQLHRSERTLPRLLSAAGYESRLFGHQHESVDAASLGYDHVNTSMGPWADAVAPAVAHFLANPPHRPFFASVGVYETHRPFHDASRYGMESAYVEPRPPAGAPAYLPPYLPDDPVVRREMAGFGLLVRRLDGAVGRILDALDRSGRGEDTLVVFTTDHGIDMPRAKGTLYDPGIETALLARWPARIRGGRASDELLSGVDLLPTLLEAAGVDPPSTIHGRSLLPLLEDRRFSPAEAVFAEKTHHCLYDPMRCIRTRRHKYIHNFGPSRPIEIPADGEMDTLASVPELYVRRRPATELFDLAEDPLECRNLSGTEEHRRIEEDLRSRLWDWMARTADPFLEQRIPMPRLPPPR